MAVAMAMAASSTFLGRKPCHLRNPSCGQCFQNSVSTIRINALFWGQKKSPEPATMDFSLGSFTLKEPDSRGDRSDLERVKTVSVSVVPSILEVSPSEWNACCFDATGPEQFNPFITHGFLSSLEESGCAVKETGWIPQHVVARDECDTILGVVPLYLKSHSYGEYVFDHSWANAYYNYGARYYPKLQCCVPFTPVTGQRILVRNTLYKDQIFDILVSAMKDLTTKNIDLKNQEKNINDLWRSLFSEIETAYMITSCGTNFQVSSLHITFPSASEWGKLKEDGFLQRIAMQYHWRNRNYKSFDEFLMDMKQSKRKNIRQERKKISAQNLTMKWLRGDEIKPRHWDTFYKFYRNTTDNKWGSAYLTREFFHNMASKMGDHVLLIVAEEGDELVAGALNLIGGNTLYGRLWGCLPEAYYPSLHFEACYYQAIEAAIELKLDTVEAGAQGEHKIQRGYLPVTTYSSHYIQDEEFRKVIADFLAREAAQVNLVMKLLNDSDPFKEDKSG